MAVRKVGKKNDAPVVFVGKQRIDTDHARVESRTAKRIGVLYLPCIAQFSAQDLLVLGLETKRSVVRTGPRGPRTFYHRRRQQGGSAWSASVAQTINTDEGAVIPDLASASSASSTDHFACARALRLRRAVQLGPGMVAASRLFDGTIMPAQPAAKQRLRERSDAACERSEFTKHKPKSSGHGTDFGSA